jgi:hypothetical protein
MPAPCLCPTCPFRNVVPNRSHCSAKRADPRHCRCTRAGCRDRSPGLWTGGCDDATCTRRLAGEA